MTDRAWPRTRGMESSRAHRRARLGPRAGARARARPPDRQPGRVVWPATPCSTIRSSSACTPSSGAASCSPRTRPSQTRTDARAAPACPSTAPVPRAARPGLRFVSRSPPRGWPHTSQGTSSTRTADGRHRSSCMTIIVSHMEGTLTRSYGEHLQLQSSSAPRFKKARRAASALPYLARAAYRELWCSGHRGSHLRLLAGQPSQTRSTFATTPTTTPTTTSTVTSGRGVDSVPAGDGRRGDEEARRERYPAPLAPGRARAGFLASHELLFAGPDGVGVLVMEGEHTNCGATARPPPATAISTLAYRMDPGATRRFYANGLRLTCALEVEPPAEAADLIAEIAGMARGRGCGCCSASLASRAARCSRPPAGRARGRSHPHRPGGTVSCSPPSGSATSTPRSRARRATVRPSSAAGGRRATASRSCAARTRSCSSSRSTRERHQRDPPGHARRRRPRPLADVLPRRVRLPRAGPRALDPRWGEEPARRSRCSPPTSAG